MARGAVSLHLKCAGGRSHENHFNIDSCLRHAVGLRRAKHVEIQRVKVPVPVECREPVPDRPVMPTEALAPGVALFELVQAALAEIDRSEGYEVRLRAALLICTAPVAKAS